MQNSEKYHIGGHINLNLMLDPRRMVVSSPTPPPITPPPITPPPIVMLALALFSGLVTLRSAR